jgi:hypothetical protein
MAPGVDGTTAWIRKQKASLSAACAALVENKTVFVALQTIGG